MENLGINATEKITGFTGVISAKCVYITGCSQYELSKQVGDDGEYPKSKWFDEGRLSISEERIFEKMQSSSDEEEAYSLLGHLAKDPVTGFHGTITGVCLYPFQEPQLLIVPFASKDGKIADSLWFERKRVKILEKVINREDMTSEENGCEFNEHP